MPNHSQRSNAAAVVVWGPERSVRETWEAVGRVVGMQAGAPEGVRMEPLTVEALGTCRVLESYCVRMVFSTNVNNKVSCH